MDKKLIERIAPLVQAAIAQGPLFPEQGERQSLAESITALVIERIDAERGKDAVAYLDPEEPFSKYAFIWEYDPDFSVRHTVPVFRSPTIPEGMALVHTELNPKQREIFASAFEHGKCILFADLWRDLLAAAQGERNAD